MKNSMSDKQKQQKLTEDLVKKCRFRKGEIECLLKEYGDIVGSSKPNGDQVKLNRNKFRDILHEEFEFTDDVIMDNVFRAFDVDSDSSISMEEWVKGLSIFLRGELEEKAKFCFTVYDLNSDGYISREEIFLWLKKTLITQVSDEDPDEGVKDLVEIALKKMDKDNDHRICFQDFVDSVHDDENLMLEYLGSCLPDAKCVRAFEQKLSR